MCFKKLGITLQDYKNGAILLFGGSEMLHYISEWNGIYRHAFDHTTHRLLANSVDFHNQNKPYWVPKTIVEKNYGNSDHEAASSGDENAENEAGPSGQPSSYDKSKKGKRKREEENIEDDGRPVNEGATRPGAKSKKKTIDKKGLEAKIGIIDLESDNGDELEEGERPPKKRAYTKRNRKAKDGTADE